MTGIRHQLLAFTKLQGVRPLSTTPAPLTLPAFPPRCQAPGEEAGGRGHPRVCARLRRAWRQALHHAHTN
eukprot:653565-Alexandrium_andersonii.AAC.1